jgi:hypothetical protein
MNLSQGIERLAKLDAEGALTAEGFYQTDELALINRSGLFKVPG